VKALQARLERERDEKRQAQEEVERITAAIKQLQQAE